MAYVDRLTTFEDSEKESEYGYVRKVSRPVVVADGMGASLSSVRTGILGNIFDGIQRPLKTIAIKSGDVYPPRCFGPCSGQRYTVGICTQEVGTLNY
ncbi:hypothetical protein ZIOFF_062239 [Zingiber officinale]|uniref:Uncharacterized protein n=1 Tax=Zingiber officinale TaxID=94328 RepID=A0A8J5K988_ZINOF|nr:hypothetical protein ZIOFF_062239 [Zingiber officinale]